MPRKEVITRGMVLDSALATVREDGLERLTARRIATRLGASTIPIYSHFRSMEDLEEEVMRTAAFHMVEYTKKPYSQHPFLNMGIGMVLFSRDAPNLFRAVFSGNVRSKQVVGDLRSSFENALQEVDDFRKFPKEDLERMLDMMLSFTVGLANMASSGLLDRPTEEHIRMMLDEAGDAVINHTIRKVLGMDASAGAVFREYQVLEGHAMKGGKAK